MVFFLKYTLFSMYNYIIITFVKKHKLFHPESKAKIGYNKLAYNEHSVIKNIYFSPKCSFTTQINPVITKPS